MRSSTSLVAWSLPLLLSAQFGPAVPIHEQPGGTALQAHDIDGDGALDLLAVDGGRILAWRNDGQGTFTELGEVLTVSEGIAHVLFSDLNGDGAVEVVLISSTHDSLLVSWNNSGTFAGPIAIDELHGMPGALGAADITGNGMPDVVITLARDGQAGIAFWPNTGGTLGAVNLVAPALNGPPPTVMALGDLDGSGAPDVLVVADGSALGLMNGNGDGTQWDIIPLFQDTDYPFTAPVLIDVDGDGDLDVADANGPAVQWAENRLVSTGGFTVHVVEPFTTAGMGGFAHLGCGAGAGLVLVPFDPGRPVHWSNHIPVIQGFAPRVTLQGVPRGQHPRFADIDGDGRPDLVLVHEGGAAWYPNVLSAPTTEVLVPSLDTLCINGPSFPLPPAAPEGGQWTGTWVQDGTLHRSNAVGNRDHPLDYTFYEPEGCPVGGRALVRLVSGPVITPALGPVLCNAHPPVQLTAQPADVQWSGLPESGVLDPTVYTGQPIAAAYLDVTGVPCVSFLGPIEVWPSVNADIRPAGPFCINEAPRPITPVTDLPGSTWSGDIVSSTNSGALFDPGQGAGEYLVVLQRTPSSPHQCSNSDTLRITVIDDIPEVGVTPLPVYCAGGTPVTLHGGMPDGGTWHGAGVSNGTLDPALVGPGRHSVAYSYTNDAGCSNSALLLVDLATEATILTPERSFCPDDDPLLFVAEPAGGVWSAPLAESGTLNPTDLPQRPYPLVYTYTDPNGCSLTNPADTVRTRPSTTVIIDPVPALCTNGKAILITGSPEGTWSGAVSGEGGSVFFDPAATGAGTWSVTLTAQAPGGCTNQSTASITVEICTGMNEQDPVAVLAAHPNPFHDLLWLTVDGHGVAWLEVIDATGRQVLQRTFSLHGATTLPIALHGVAPGTYVLRLHDGNGTRQVRVVKG